MTEISGNSSRDFNPAADQVNPHHDRLRASDLPEVDSMYLEEPNPGHPPYHCYLSTTRSIDMPEGLDTDTGEIHTGIYDLFRAAGVNALIHSVMTLEALSQNVQAKMGELHNIEPNKDGQRLDRRFGLQSAINDLTIIYRGTREDQVTAEDSRTSFVRSRSLEKTVNPRIKSAAELKHRTEAIGHTILDVALPTEQLASGELGKDDIQRLVAVEICRAFLRLSLPEETQEPLGTERRSFSYVVLPSWHSENPSAAKTESRDMAHPEREALAEQLATDFSTVVDVQFRPSDIYDENRNALPLDEQGTVVYKYPIAATEDELVPGYVRPEHTQEILARFLTAKWRTLRKWPFGRR